MSLPESLQFDGPDSMANVGEFIDPQYTVKRCGTTQLGFMTPEPSPTDTTPRHGSFALSDNRRASFCGSSVTSSLLSLSGCGTPCLSTPGSSASNSRRQSMLLPESQQYYLSAISSSPSNRPQGPKRAAPIDQCHLQEFPLESYFANSNSASMVADGTADCEPGAELAMIVDSVSGNASRDWPSCSSQAATSSLYCRTAHATQNEELASWSRGYMALHQQLLDHNQPALFESLPSQPVGETYNTEGNSSPNTPSLAPPFEPNGRKYNTDEDYVSVDLASHVRTVENSCFSLTGQSLSENLSSPSDDDPEYDNPASRIVKRHSRKQRQHLSAPYEYEIKHDITKPKIHRCKKCKYACSRPEHLKRHEHSVHWEAYGDAPDMLPCAFEGCIDRKTGRHREIIFRSDNLKAHYTKTHFKYSSEKGGKNDRKSMKAAHEMGLNVYDLRWTMLLQGKMNVNHEIKDYLHVWKMLGYSILETRDIKVKDVVPNVKDVVPKWEEPEDATLQKFDPRWRALWDGTLTFDQATSIGRGMKESHAQGLLGVTMLETEAMGLQHLDPRWTEMLSGRMSLEQAEKLGVKPRYPMVARRRPR